MYNLSKVSLGFNPCCSKPLVVVFRRKHFRLKCFNFWNRFSSTHALHCVLTVAWHIFFIRVDATNEDVHELIVEPVQEPRAEEQQQVAVEHAPEDFVNPADLQGKPRSITIF